MFDNGLAEQRPLFRRPLIPQPIIADGDRTGHHRRVEEMGGIPVLEAGGGIKVRPRPLQIVFPARHVEGVGKCCDTLQNLAADAEQTAAIA